LVLLSACKTYDFFTITVLEPAEIALPVDFKRVVIIHNLYRTPGDTLGTIYSLSDRMKRDTTYLYDEIASEAIYSLHDFLNSSGRFEAMINDSTHLHFPKSVNDFTMNDVDVIRQLCKQNNAEAVIMLNNLGTFDKYDVMTDQYGGYFGQFEVILTTSWLFINPFAAKLNDTKLINDTLYFQTEPWYFNGDVNELNFRKDIMIQSAGQAGISYGKRISPFWTETERLVFKSGCKEIVKGYKSSQQGNWTGAASYWQIALNDPQLLNQAKAAFNLGLASEMDGTLEPAIGWVRKSVEIFPDTINKIYLKILEIRLIQQDDIYYQMEGIKK
jgi:tetratricopeptide (TPR) repeat protein